MTVATQIDRSGPYAGAGTTGPFTVSFRFLDATHLQVIRTDGTGEHVLTLTTDYTVAGVGNPTGSVTLVAALPVGQTLTIIRKVPKTQEADYVQNSDFPAESHEDALDKLTMIAQETGEVVDRAITLPTSDSSLLIKELPIATLRANKAVVFGPDGSVGVSVDDYNNQAANAAASAAAAAASAASASSSANSAAASYDSFDDRWLGPKAADPTLDNDGNALLEGAAYWNIGGSLLKVWSVAGAVWTAINSFVQSGVGAITRTWQDKAQESISILDFIPIAERAAIKARTTTFDCLTAFNNAMVEANARGGADILMPGGLYKHSGTIDNKYPRVRFIGLGGVNFHDSGTETNRTTLQPTFAGTAMKIRTPYAAEQGVAVGLTKKNLGSACIGIEFQGGGVATHALEIDTVSFVEVDCYATGFVGTFVYKVMCGITGTDLGEACDVQHSRIFLRARQIDTAGEKASGIAQLTGSSNANVSLNRGPLHGITVLAQHWDGDVLDIVTADNNDISVSAIRPGGAGRTMLARGVTASFPVGCESNNFVYVAGAGAVYAQGTSDGGVTAGVLNRIENLDTGNGTPAPTIGTGSRWQYVENSNITFGAAFTPTAFAEDVANAKTTRAAMGNETIRIRNASSNHTVLVDQLGNSWGVGIDGGTGDLRMLRLAGTGAVNVGNGAPVKIGGKLVTEGAADSGGAGFRVLRVPN